MANGCTGADTLRPRTLAGTVGTERVNGKVPFGGRTSYGDPHPRRIPFVAIA